MYSHFFPIFFKAFSPIFIDLFPNFFHIFKSKNFVPFPKFQWIYSHFFPIFLFPGPAPASQSGAKSGNSDKAETPKFQDHPWELWNPSRKSQILRFSPKNGIFLFSLPKLGIFPFQYPKNGYSSLFLWKKKGISPFPTRKNLDYPPFSPKITLQWFFQGKIPPFFVL